MRVLLAVRVVREESVRNFRDAAMSVVGRVRATGVTAGGSGPVRIGEDALVTVRGSGPRSGGRPFRTT
jgi:hypothetical protein